MSDSVFEIDLSHLDTLKRLVDNINSRKSLVYRLDDRTDIHRTRTPTSTQYTINVICVNGTFAFGEHFELDHNEKLIAIFTNIIQKIFQQNNANIFGKYYDSLILSYKDQFVIEFHTEEVNESNRKIYAYYVNLEQFESEYDIEKVSDSLDTLNMVMTGLVATLSVVGFVLWFNRKQ